MPRKALTVEAMQLYWGVWFKKPGFFSLVLNLPIILLTENTITTREAKVFMSCPFNQKIISL
jgi:hypothetical protein